MEIAPVLWGDGHRGVPWRERAGIMRDIGFSSRDQGLLLSIGTHFWAAGVVLARFPVQASNSEVIQIQEGIGRGTRIAAFAMTEPAGGSDATSAGTTATGDPIRLTGQKRYITNAGCADAAVVFATQVLPDSSRVPSCFLVDTSASGLLVRPHPAPRPLSTCPLGDFDLDQVGVLAQVGQPGQGRFAFSAAMEYERTYISAGLLGVAEALIRQAATALTAARRASPRLSTYGLGSSAVADLAMRAMACWALVDSVAQCHDHGRRDLAGAAAVKALVSRLLMDAALELARLSGARAAVDASIWEQVADARLAATYSGTDDVQHMIIARAMGVDVPGGHG